ncbi:MAG: hypothetical protein AB7G93_21790 [Bdellovibrionales bacterium]
MKIRTKTVIVAGLLSSAALGAHASTYFCEPQAKAAVSALADVNGTVNESVVVASASDDGKSFEVQAQEPGIGTDYYEVETTGGHECLVLSVKAKARPTVRP